MGLNAQAIRLLAEKGLTASDIAELAEMLEVRRDPTAAERMRRYRAKKEEGVTVTRNVTDVTENQPPNEYISNPPKPQTANAVSPPFSAKVVSAWNDGPGKAGATPCRGKLNPQRQAHLRARVRENSEDVVLQAIANLASSKFHCGENDRNWKASLGWMLKSAENFEKCMELATPPLPFQSGKQWTAEERAAHLAKLDRMGLGGETPVPKPPPEQAQQRTGQRPIGQLVNRIRDQAA